MATIDLGRIKPVWQGTWAGSTAYEVEDIVRYGNDSYICTTAHTSDATTFSNDSAYWELMSQGANIPSQSGQSGKALTTDGTNLVWGEGGKVLQTASSWNTTKHSSTASMSTYFENTSSTQGTQIASVSMTRQSSTSKIYVWGHSSGQISNNQAGGVGLFAGSTRLAMSLSNGYAGDVWGCSPHCVVPSSLVGSGAVTYQVRMLGARDGSGMYSYQYNGNQNMGNFYSGITVMEIEV